MSYQKELILLKYLFVLLLFLVSGMEAQFGYKKVKEEFNSVTEKTPGEIVDHLKDSVAYWANGTVPEDDITFVVIKMK